MQNAELLYKIVLLVSLFFLFDSSGSILRVWCFDRLVVVAVGVKLLLFWHNGLSISNDVVIVKITNGMKWQPTHILDDFTVWSLFSQSEVLRFDANPREH